MRTLIRILLAFQVCALISFNCLAQSGIITTHVGPGLPMDGALATTQSIDTPASVAPDGIGGFYIASYSQNRIYRVAADERIRLAAGSGAPDYGGDGTQAA
jgi:hypothetical protein